MKDLSEWHEYCSGKTDFEASYFFSLFTLELSREELEEVFSYFPHRLALADRMEQVKNAGTLDSRPYIAPLESNSLEKQTLIQLAQRHVTELADMCALAGEDEMSLQVNSTELEYCDSVADFDTAQSDDNGLHMSVYETIGDYLAEQIIDHSKVYALEEAIYGLSANYYLTMYVLAPLMRGSARFDGYYELWKAGGECVLSDSKALVRSVTAD